MEPAPLRIAVVDDEEAIRRAFFRLFRSAGLEVETYPSGEEFLDSLGSRAPDCVVLDLHMPRVNGFDVQARLAKSGSRIPVIAITGHDTEETHDRAMKGGAAAYLRKPIDEETLLNTIADVVGGKAGGA
ncbi:MAG TPA: response regulator [Thermoanaerobaculia bacterium]|nr:response regulator [Thermoanaerobaculia bacterium]